MCEFIRLFLRRAGALSFVTRSFSKWSILVGREIGTHETTELLHSVVYTNRIGCQKARGLVESLGALSNMFFT